MWSTRFRKGAGAQPCTTPQQRQFEHSCATIMRSNHRTCGCRMGPRPGCCRGFRRCYIYVRSIWLEGTKRIQRKRTPYTGIARFRIPRRPGFLSTRKLHGSVPAHSLSHYDSVRTASDQDACKVILVERYMFCGYIRSEQNKDGGGAEVESCPMMVGFHERAPRSVQ